MSLTQEQQDFNDDMQSDEDIQKSIDDLNDNEIERLKIERRKFKSILNTDGRIEFIWYTLMASKQCC